VSEVSTTRVSETADRFLRTIADRLGADKVAEVYLFPPLRQGPIESAVAVVAVTDGSPPAGEDAIDVARPNARHAIYTATYRHTRKGRDRGAWAVDIVVQADAPLGAVAAVVRGVQRRSDDACAGLQFATGEAWSDPDRLSGPEFRAIIDPASTDSREAAAARATSPREAVSLPGPAADGGSAREGTA
jgi:hypothetical protein